MNKHHEVEDVEFKEGPLEVKEEQEREQEKEEKPEQVQDPKAPTLPFRVLHVQVRGNPDQKKLEEVAQAFNVMLKGGESAALVTSPDVSSYVVSYEGQAPITGIYARSTLSLEDLAKLAYSFEHLGQDAVEWQNLVHEQRLVKINAIREVAMNRRLPPKGPAGEHIHQMVMSLRHLLPAPAEDQQIEVWTGQANLNAAGAWLQVPFSSLKKGMVFRQLDSKDTFRSAATNVYIDYQLEGHALYGVEAIECEVSGSEAVDPNDMNKGFTLTWKVKGAQQTQDQKGEERAENESPMDEDEYVPVIDEQEAQAVRNECAAAVERGELHPEGSEDEQA
jgi:hypothetical protein